MTIREEFLDLLAAPRAQKMKAIERAIFDALRDGDEESLPSLRADFAIERDRPASITGESREDLVAQWPANYPPLPEWFTNPESVEPLGETCVIICSPPEPDPDGDEEEQGEVAPALETQILATRRERAIEEDAVRDAGRSDGRAAVHEDFGLVAAEA